MTCDYCQKKAAKYDAKTKYGPWAFMCQECFNKHGVKTPGLFTELKFKEDENDDDTKF